LESIYPACATLWVQFPSFAKNKTQKNGEEDKWHQCHFIHL
jgi:hypothetical protein